MGSAAQRSCDTECAAGVWGIFNNVFSLTRLFFESLAPLPSFCIFFMRDYVPTNVWHGPTVGRSEDRRRLAYSFNLLVWVCQTGRQWQCRIHSAGKLENGRSLFTKTSSAHTAKSSNFTPVRFRSWWIHLSFISITIGVHLALELIHPVKVKPHESQTCVKTAKMKSSQKIKGDGKKSEKLLQIHKSTLNIDFVC